MSHNPSTRAVKRACGCSRCKTDLANSSGVRLHVATSTQPASKSLWSTPAVIVASATSIICTSSKQSTPADTGRPSGSSTSGAGAAAASSSAAATLAVALPPASAVRAAAVASACTMDVEIASSAAWKSSWRSGAEDSVTSLRTSSAIASHGRAAAEAAAEAAGAAAAVAAAAAGVTEKASSISTDALC